MKSFFSALGIRFALGLLWLLQWLPLPILAALGTCYANRESTAQADRVPKTSDFLDRLLDRYRVWSA